VYRLVPALTIALLATLSHAQVYRHVDKEGNVTFTDAPPPDAQPVEIGPTNTASPPPTAYPKREPEKADGEAEIKYSINITAPAHESIFHGGGNFTVNASITPGLKEAHMLQLLMNGAPRGEAQKSTTWPLTNVFRGEQVLSVTVVDDKGEQIAQSEPVTVYVFRPSSNRKR